MRILVTTHYYAEHCGGVEIVAEELGRRLTHRGIEVVWAASKLEPVSVDTAFRRLPMRTLNFTERRLGFPYPLWGPLSLLRLCREVRRCDLLHIHDSLYMGNVVAFVWARLLGKPVVVTQHVGWIPYSRTVLRGLLALANHTLGWLVLAGSNRSVFCSKKVQTYFSRFIRFRTPPRYIPNGVATETFCPIGPEQRQRLRARFGWPADKLIMLFVGRFVEKKGLRILRDLAECFPECEWVFVGWGPDNPLRWGLPNVRCPGSLSREEIAPYYQAADLLVLPSVGEGFPLVVQEAMACGTPALISKDTALAVPGIEDVALVSDLDHQHLTTIIRGIIDAPASLQARREVVADFARQHWDWEVCADQYEQLFAEVCAGKREETLGDEAIFVGTDARLKRPVHHHGRCRRLL
ncbi:MAG TPA: glycosyltransferase family 4 protein [Gemmataceae bacterium]|nr:glycosyltransferase family 4 protein [Gemmataceae bacterium]